MLRRVITGPSRRSAIRNRPASRHLLADEPGRFVHPSKARGSRIEAGPRGLSWEWLRRASFDLTGLPPTPEQVNAFQPDDTGTVPESRYAAQVDEWLSSSAFGQRWARHWLDVARFAESAGKERNHPFPEAWRYRDWVVDAFNADKPYAEFVREQIAGDLLATTAPPEQRDALIIATGFLAIGTKGLNENRREQFLADLVDEQIDTTTRAILGVTVACARCHDHKSDPISQRDYYALAGIFRSTETCYGTTGDAARNRQPSKLIPLERSPRAELAQEPQRATPARRRPREREAKPQGLPTTEPPTPWPWGSARGGWKTPSPRPRGGDPTLRPGTPETNPTAGTLLDGPHSGL